MIPYGRQIIDEADIRAVADVLRSDYLTQGPAVPGFQNPSGRHIFAEFQKDVQFLRDEVNGVSLLLQQALISLPEKL